mmetsp:Transcript_5885/g.12987  ORF Transcript_5885/g.12987 Transcript_5885/m.12987 type:complete len:205 (+) Transcript_5885:319-933(+)
MPLFSLFWDAEGVGDDLAHRVVQQPLQGRHALQHRHLVSAGRAALPAGLVFILKPLLAGACFVLQLSVCPLQRVATCVCVAVGPHCQDVQLVLDLAPTRLGQLGRVVQQPGLPLGLVGDPLEAVGVYLGHDLDIILRRRLRTLILLIFQLLLRLHHHRLPRVPLRSQKLCRQRVEGLQRAGHLVGQGGVLANPMRQLLDLEGYV